MGKISVLGCGWGTALALAAYRNHHDVTMWSPFEEEVRLLKEKHEHEKLLPGVKIPDDIKITTDLSEVDGSDFTIIAVPSKFIRQTAVKLKPIKNPGIIVNASKGIEEGSLLRLSQVISQELPGRKVAVLSGPSHAEEVAREIPTTVVTASENIEVAKQVQQALMHKTLRIYTNQDVIGVELGGALKNIIAVCAGICDGLGLGDNTKAALITRGLTEIARLGVKMGAMNQTFAGLTGLGDLVVTCTSMHSRNRRFGILVGQSVPIDEALERIGTVEGYYATKTAWQLSQRYGVEMPITYQCYKTLYENYPVKEVVYNLMLRPGKHELEQENTWIDRIKE
ncbi:MAG TPA: NAD(P)-dependent glycerol-3-phosphate dehydrogenase [Clostridiales bacterium]|nr:NAD(P)-dependent glycerol-3-phosphate dehydrogenase [Clostridiales bacterium]